jgi:Holliday junction resolvase RusA-like endonuclease
MTAPGLIDRAMLQLVVHGFAQPAGSKRQVRNPRTGATYVIDANPQVAEWKRHVRDRALEAMGRDELSTLTGPVRLEVEVYTPRPKSHYGAGRNATRLLPSARAWPTVKPDLTKLLRAIEDALTQASVWIDDTQVVIQTASKRYGTPARAFIRVTEIDGDEL